MAHLGSAVDLVHTKDLMRLTREGAPDLNAIKHYLLPGPEMMALERSSRIDSVDFAVE